MSIQDLILLAVSKGQAKITCGWDRFALTTSEKATESDPRRIEDAAVYLLLTTVAIKLHESAPSNPDRKRYDLLRYPKSGMESLKGESR